MKDLDTFNDRIVAFWAVPKSAAEQPSERQPLQPTERRVSQQRVLSPVSADYASPYHKSLTVPKDGAPPRFGFVSEVGRRHSPRSSSQIQDENVPPKDMPASSVAKPVKLNHYGAPQPALFPLQPLNRSISDGLRSGPSFVRTKANQAQNAAFQRYLADYRVQFLSKWVPGSGIPLDDGYILSQAWDAWEQLVDDQRALYDNPNHSAFIAESSLMHIPDRKSTTPWPAVPNISAEQQPLVLSAPGEIDLACKEEDAADLDFKDHFTHLDDPASQTEVVQPQFFHLQNIIADASLDVLEASVERGVKFLDDLKQPLVQNLESSPDAAQWVQQIERLQKQAV